MGVGVGAGVGVGVGVEHWPAAPQTVFIKQQLLLQLELEVQGNP